MYLLLLLYKMWGNCLTTLSEHGVTFLILSDQHFKTQSYLIYNGITKRKAANVHIVIPLYPHL